MKFVLLYLISGPAECLGMDGLAPVRAFVFPRPTLSEDKKKEFAPFVVNDIPACFSIHFSHGYEDDKTGNIVSYFSVSVLHKLNVKNRVCITSD